MLHAGKKNAYSVGVHRTQVFNLYALLNECRAATDSCTTIARQLLGHGVGLFYGSDEVTPLPTVLRRWVRGGWVSRFVHDCVKQLACFGLCVCRVHPETMEASVADLRLLSIVMHATAERGVEYEITDRDGDTAYFIQVLVEPDAFSGETRGALSRITEAFCDGKLYARNAIVRDTVNSEALFLLENPHGERQIQGYMTATRGTGESGGPLAQTLAGYSVSVDTVLNARADIKEEMWLQSGQFIRNMTPKPRSMKMLRSMYPVADDVNPSECQMQPVEPGVTAKQRSALPGVSDAINMFMYNERQIYMAFGVPFTLVEEHTGAHTNTMDTDNNQLQQTCMRYVDPLQEILENVSIALFGKDTLEKVYKKLVRRMDTALRGSKVDEKMRDKVFETTADGDEPLSLRVMTVTPARKMQLWYENGLLKHSAYIGYLVDTTQSARSMFETRDVRPIMIEPADDTAVGDDADAVPDEKPEGPGHHGELTLSKENGQQQSTDPTATLKRKRKMPGSK